MNNIFVGILIGSTVTAFGAFCLHRYIQLRYRVLCLESWRDEMEKMSEKLNKKNGNGSGIGFSEKV